MKFTLRHGILGCLLLLFAWGDLSILTQSPRPHDESFFLLALATVPVQATLLAFWSCFSALGLPSRLAGISLGGIALGLVMFRATRGDADFAAILAVLVVTPHLALSICGFRLANRVLGLTLLDRGIPTARGSNRMAFSLWQLLAWTTGAAVVALLARFALTGITWELSLGAQNLRELVVAGLLIGFPALLTPRGHPHTLVGRFRTAQAHGCCRLVFRVGLPCGGNSPFSY